MVGTPYGLPFSPQAVTVGQYPDLVLGESGVAFASGSTTATVNGAPTVVSQIASFNISSGALNWTYQATTGITLSLVEATAGNGLAAKSTDQTGTDTVLIFKFRRNRVRHGSTTDETTGAEFSSARGFQWAITD